MGQEDICFAPPTAPGNNATAVLFNSVTAFGPQMMRMLGITMIQVIYLRLNQASAAGGLKAYGSSNGGVDWIQLDYKDANGVATMPKQIPICATGNVDTESFDVTAINDFKLEHTAGATGPTSGTGWDLVITALCRAASVLK